VQRAGDVVRISASLIRAADRSTLWVEQYDRPYKDLFALQDEITKAVAVALRAKLLGSAATTEQSDRPPSGNLAAYEAVLQGNFAFQRQNEAETRKAIVLYEQATKAEPDYAYAGRDWQSPTELSLHTRHFRSRNWKRSGPAPKRRL
jgi:Predicted integral membrane protein